MGAKTWMLAYSDGNADEILKAYPSLDRTAIAALAKQLFPTEKREPLDEGMSDAEQADPEKIPLARFKHRRSRWKFW